MNEIDFKLTLSLWELRAWPSHSLAKAVANKTVRATTTFILMIKLLPSECGLSDDDFIRSQRIKSTN